MHDASEGKIVGFKQMKIFILLLTAPFFSITTTTQWVNFYTMGSSAIKKGDHRSPLSKYGRDGEDGKDGEDGQDGENGEDGGFGWFRGGNGGNGGDGGYKKSDVDVASTSNE